MKRLVGLLVAALLAFAPAVATASVTTTGAGKVPSGGGGGGYTGPGDIVSGAKSWYGLRAYSAAVAATGTQKAVNVTRASDSHTCDILIATNGDLGSTAAACTDGVVAAATWCSSICTINTWYDQSGNGFNASTSSDPGSTLVFSCQGGKACTAGSGAQSLNVASFTTLAQPLTISAVAIRTSGTSQSDILVGSVGVYFKGADTLAAYFGAEPTVAATDNVWHALQFVVNDAVASSIRVDGTANTGQTMGTSSLDAYQIWRQSGGSFLTGKIAEVGVWPLAFTSGQQTSMCGNQNTYYTLGKTC